MTATNREPAKNFPGVIEATALLRAWAEASGDPTALGATKAITHHNWVAAHTMPAPHNYKSSAARAALEAVRLGHIPREAFNNANDGDLPRTTTGRQAAVALKLLHDAGAPVDQLRLLNSVYGVNPDEVSFTWHGRPSQRDSELSVRPSEPPQQTALTDWPAAVPAIDNSGPIPEPERPEVLQAPVVADGVGAKVVRSAPYQDQLRLAGRVAVDDTAVATLIDEVLAAPGQRISSAQAADVLGVAETRVSLALGQVAKVLNVEGYAVIAVDPGTRHLILDEALLAEQFGVTS